MQRSFINKKMEYTKNIILVLLLSFICGSLFYLSSKFVGKQNLGSSSFYSWGSTSISSVTVNRTIKQTVEANAGRRSLLIQNNSTSTWYCLLDGSTTAASSSVTSTPGAQIGFTIQPSSTADGGKFYNEGYVGVVNCTTDSNNASGTVIIGI